MIDRTEQERLIIIFNCAQKYYNMKGFNTEWHKVLMRIRAQNDTLEAAQSHSVQAA